MKLFLAALFVIIPMNFSQPEPCKSGKQLTAAINKKVVWVIKRENLNANTIRFKLKHRDGSTITGRYYRDLKLFCQDARDVDA